MPVHIRFKSRFVKANRLFRIAVCAAMKPVVNLLKNEDNSFHSNSTRPNVANPESECSRGKSEWQDDNAGPSHDNAVGHRYTGHSIYELIPDDRRGGAASRSSLGYDHFSSVYESGDLERTGNDRCPRDNSKEEKRNKLSNESCTSFEC